MKRRETPPLSTPPRARSGWRTPGRLERGLAPSAAKRSAAPEAVAPAAAEPPAPAPAAAAPPARSPGGTTLATLRRFLLAQLAIVRAQEAGVFAGSDPEALHDFRVAVRRTRSALGQIPHVLPEETVAPLRAELAWLGGATGPPRDLDVLREALPDDLEPLPAWVQEGVRPIERTLARRAREAREALAASLGSTRYRALLRAWSRAARQRLAPDDTAPDKSAQGRKAPLRNALRPVEEVAARRSRKAARRVARHLRRLGAHPEPAELHALRIACKKLRYLLELFRPLAEPEAAQLALGRLKGLQDLLGTANDLAVQQAELRRLAAEPETRAEMEADEDIAPACLATGYLVAALDRRREKVLAELHDLLTGGLAVLAPAAVGDLFRQPEAP